jgi:glycosyltransferase involved in cell wall biosynthesis
MDRVLFVTKHLRAGGAQRLWAILIPALRARGVDARLLTLEDEGAFYAQLRQDGVPVDCARMRGRVDLPRLLAGLRRAERPDVVVTYDERSHLVGALLALRLGIPQVAGDYTSPGFPWKIHRRLILRLVGRRFASAVTVAAGRNADLARLGVRPERIRVITCGVDTERFRPTRSRAEVRAALGLAPDAFVALLPVVLRPEKQPARFVDAVARAHARDARIHGLVTGYGPLEAEIRAQAAAHPEVSILGHRDDMADVVAASDVICLTSDFEAVPYALLEAMALARPVVAYVAEQDLTAVPAELAAELPVLRADPTSVGEVLRGLAETPPERRAELGERSRRYVERWHDPRRIAEQLLPVYERAAGRRVSA